MTTDTVTATSYLPLIGENIQLRPLQMADAEEMVVAALESLDTVGRWMNWCHAGYQLTDAQQWINFCAESLLEQKQYQLGIFCKQGKHLHGAISINLIVRLHQGTSKNRSERSQWRAENRSFTGVKRESQVRQWPAQ